MRFYLIILISFIALNINAQKSFDHSKFKKMELKDSIHFQIDIDYKLEYPYHIVKGNIQTAPASGFESGTIKDPGFHYGMYHIVQDSVYDVFIVLSSSRDLKKPFVGKHMDALISLFLYDKEKELFKDTLVLAKKSLWINHIGSGDEIYLADYQSTLYIDAEGGISKIYLFQSDGKFHSAYNRGYYKPEYRETLILWRNGFTEN